MSPALSRQRAASQGRNREPGEPEAFLPGLGGRLRVYLLGLPAAQTCLQKESGTKTSVSPLTRRAERHGTHREVSPTAERPADVPSPPPCCACYTSPVYVLSVALVSSVTRARDLKRQPALPGLFRRSTVSYLTPRSLAAALAPLADSAGSERLSL